MLALLVVYGYNVNGYKLGEGPQNGDDPTNWTVPYGQLEETADSPAGRILLQESNGNWQAEFDQNTVKQFAIFLTKALALPLPAK